MQPQVWRHTEKPILRKTIFSEKTSSVLFCGFCPHHQSVSHPLIPPPSIDINKLRTQTYMEYKPTIPNKSLLFIMRKPLPPCQALLTDALAHNYLNLGVYSVTIFWITPAPTLFYYKHLCNYASWLIWRMWQRDGKISPTGNKNLVFEDKYILQNS